MPELQWQNVKRPRTKANQFPTTQHTRYTHRNRQIRGWTGKKEPNERNIYEPTGFKWYNTMCTTHTSDSIFCLASVCVCLPCFALHLIDSIACMHAVNTWNSFQSQYQLPLQPNSEQKMSIKRDWICRKPNDFEWWEWANEIKEKIKSNVERIRAHTKKLNLFTGQRKQTFHL